MGNPPVNFANQHRCGKPTVSRSEHDLFSWGSVQNIYLSFPGKGYLRGHSSWVDNGYIDGIYNQPKVIYDLWSSKKLGLMIIPLLWP